MKSSVVLKSSLLLAIFAAFLLQAKPARAVTPQEVASALESAYSAYKKYNGKEFTLRQATDEILSALLSAKTAIIARIDGIAAAEARACATAVIINTERIKKLSSDNRQSLALKSVECMSLIESLLEEVDDRAAVDKLGFALNALGPNALLAHAHAGLIVTTSLTDLIKNGNLAVMAKLSPSCSDRSLHGDHDGGVLEIMIRCRAYNGDRGIRSTYQGDPKYNQIWKEAEDIAVRNTSWLIAEAVNTALPGVLPPPPQQWRFMPNR